MKREKIQYIGLLTILIVLGLISYGSMSGVEGQEEKELITTENAQTPSGVHQIIGVPTLKEQYTFAGELIPIENHDVRERLQRELIVNTHYHSATILNLLRSQRYFKEIDKVLTRRGIPTDFKYLAVAESNLDYVTSPAGARGIWQIMPSVARHYGLEVNSAIDERNHFEKSTEAACSLIEDYYKRFGSWILTAAAYNAGETRIAKSMKSQKADSYFDLNLNSETMRYVFRVVALKDILENPQEYGFYVDESEKYEPLNDYKIVEVNETIHDLGEFAQKHGITYRELKIHNPWMLKEQLPDKSRKLYQIKIPEK